MSVEQELSAVYRRHARDLRKLVVKQLRQGASRRAVEREIDAYIRRNDVADDLRERLSEAAQQQFDWVDQRTLSLKDRELSRRVLSDAGEGFARMEEQLNEELKREVIRGIEEEVPLPELESRLVRRLDIGKNQAFTVGNTAFSGYDQASFWRQAEEVAEDGEQMLFEYVGPPPQRSFCERHIGNVYTEEQIDRLENGQGLDVRLFGGGYNCRHRWVLAPSDATPDQL